MKRLPMKQILTFVAVFAIMVSTICVSPNYAISAQAAKKVTVKSIKSVDALTGSKTIYLAKGKKAKIKTTVTVTPSSSSNKKVTYISSNKKVAPVNGKGVVTGRKVGTAKITVASKKNPKKKTTVTVKVLKGKVTNVKLDKSAESIFVGDSITLKPTVTATAGGKKNVVWSSSKKEVATVKNGTVVAVAPGTTTITAKAIDGTGKKATCKVTIQQKESTPGNTTPGNTTPTTVLISGLSLSDIPESINIGEKKTVTVAVSPENATNKNIEWSVSPAGVVELTPNGLSAEIKAIGKGDATIVAKATDGSNKQVSCRIDVWGIALSISSSNPDYLEFDSYEHESSFIDYSLSGYVSWEKVKDTLQYELPEGYTVSLREFVDPDWVYRKGDLDIKNSDGKVVDSFSIEYYVIGLRGNCKYTGTNKQIKVNIEEDEDYNYIYITGNIPWKQVDKKTLTFTCTMEGFEVVPIWKDTDDELPHVGYLEARGIGESVACEKYKISYINTAGEIDEIKYTTTDLVQHEISTSSIKMYGMKPWDEIKDKITYYHYEDNSGSVAVNVQYGDAVNDESVALLNVMDGDTVIRSYNIIYVDCTEGVSKVSCNSSALLRYSVCNDYEYSSISLYGTKPWEEIKNELTYSNSYSGDFKVSYTDDGGDYDDVLDILDDNNNIVRSYNIDYCKCIRLSYNANYLNLGITKMNIYYSSDYGTIEIYSNNSASTDLTTLMQQLNFNCPDVNGYTCEYSDNYLYIKDATGNVITRYSVENQSGNYYINSIEGTGIRTFRESPRNNEISILSENYRVPDDLEITTIPGYSADYDKDNEAIIIKDSTGTQIAYRSIRVYGPEDMY